MTEELLLWVLESWRTRAGGGPLDLFFGFNLGFVGIELVEAVVVAVFELGLVSKLVELPPTVRKAISSTPPFPVIPSVTDANTSTPLTFAIVVASAGVVAEDMSGLTADVGVSTLVVGDSTSRSSFSFALRGNAPGILTSISSILTFGSLPLDLIGLSRKFFCTLFRSSSSSARSLDISSAPS